MLAQLSRWHVGLMVVAGFALLAARSAPAGDFYRWFDEKGQLQTTTTPPPGGVTPIETPSKPPQADPGAPASADKSNKKDSEDCARHQKLIAEWQKVERSVRRLSALLEAVDDTDVMAAERRCSSKGSAKGCKEGSFNREEASEDVRSALAIQEDRLAQIEDRARSAGVPPSCMRELESN